MIAIVSAVFTGAGGIALAYLSLSASGAAQANGETLSTPNGLAAGTVTATSVPLSWSDSAPWTASALNTPSVKYLVYRCIGSSCTPTVTISTGGCATTNYTNALSSPNCTDTTALPNHTYGYAVAAVYKTWTAAKSAVLYVKTPKATTTTTVTSSVNPSITGQAVTFTATVSSSYVTPTGSVTFTIKKHTGAKISCTTSTSKTLSSGKATCTPTTALTTTGSPYTVKATYPGNATYGSSSGTLTQNVAGAPTVTFAAQEASETTTSATSANFTGASGVTYLIFAAHTSSSGDSATLTSTAALRTIHQIATATTVEMTGITGTVPSYEWAWYATGTGSSGTATVTFAKAATKTTATPLYNVLEVIKATNLTTTTPVFGPAKTTVGKTASSTFTTKSATVNFNTAATYEQLGFIYIAGDDQHTTGGSKAPTWSTGVTPVNGASQRAKPKSSAGDGADVVTAPASVTSGTAYTKPSGWPTTNTTAFGAIVLQLNPDPPGTTTSVAVTTPGTVTGIQFVPLSGGTPNNPVCTQSGTLTTCTVTDANGSTVVGLIELYSGSYPGTSVPNESGSAIPISATRTAGNTGGSAWKAWIGTGSAYGVMTITPTGPQSWMYSVTVNGTTYTCTINVT